MAPPPSAIALAPTKSGDSQGRDALGGFGIPVKDEQLFGPDWDHGVYLSLLIGEFH
ncbi:MAG TPA: hypothetical protein VMQ86_05805 [Bryobacteraceae bacterium]|nr:hypothetical protein [Bryobacteraceae bacterium]